MLQRRRFQSGLAVLLFGLIFVTAVRAQVTFTITATASSDGFTTGNGYAAGNSYTFVFTMPASYPDNPDSGFTNVGPSAMAWTDESTITDANLFTSISGSGVGGAYVRPTAAAYSPNSNVITTSTSLNLLVSEDAPSTDIGLTALSSTVLGHIGVSANVTAFAQPGTYLEPVSYFAPYDGIYSSATGSVILVDSNSNNVGAFVITSVAISAIPEPATTAVLIGLAGLGAVLLARRRRTAA